MVVFVRRVSVVVAIAGCLLGTPVAGQRRGAPPPPASPRAAAPVDLTGYWVSLVTEDWRYRVTVPPKGDYGGLPLNQAGRKAAAAWDAALADAPDERCKPFGAAGVMRVPGRLRISWDGEDALRLETDAGAQVRRLPFRSAPVGPGTWQGASVASWDRGETPMGRGGFFPGPTVRGGSLKVITSNMKPGYLLRNGAPYSAQAVLTEYFDRFDLPGGESLLVVASELVDPVYLTQPFWTSTQFKQLTGSPAWNPKACE